MEGNQAGERGEQKTLTQFRDKPTKHLFCATSAFISIAQLNWQKKKVICRKNIEFLTFSKAWEPALYLSVFILQYTTCILKLNRFKWTQHQIPMKILIFFPPQIYKLCLVLFTAISISFRKRALYRAALNEQISPYQVNMQRGNPPLSSTDLPGEAVSATQLQVGTYR